MDLWLWPVAPRYNPEFKPRAAEALESADKSYAAAVDAEKNNHHEQAGQALVVAWEEIAKARIYWMCYEDIATTDPGRAKERLFISQRDIDRSHDAKVAFLQLMMMMQLLAKFMELVASIDPKDIPEDQDEFDAWMMEKFPEDLPVIQMAKQLEAIRQSPYSGSPTVGTGRVPFGKKEYGILSEAISFHLGFAHYEQEVWKTPDAVLESFQKSLPSHIAKYGAKLKPTWLKDFLQTQRD